VEALMASGSRRDAEEATDAAAGCAAAGDDVGQRWSMALLDADEGSAARGALAPAPTGDHDVRRRQTPPDSACSRGEAAEDRTSPRGSGTPSCGRIGVRLPRGTRVADQGERRAEGLRGDVAQGHGRRPAYTGRAPDRVGQGRSNKEVAAILFLSPKTVEFHLGHVYRKLHVANRTALSRVLQRSTGQSDSGEPVPPWASPLA
jgi:hypothetical protein